MDFQMYHLLRQAMGFQILAEYMPYFSSVDSNFGKKNVSLQETKAIPWL